MCPFVLQKYSHEVDRRGAKDVKGPASLAGDSIMKT
jgi:hypothetical protein